ncbi:MAG: hypothetical protein NTZ05_23325 [Chloroflexi bacterium]|nr:hypothetical protein [Chloroflexota bacterium]
MPRIFKPVLAAALLLALAACTEDPAPASKSGIGAPAAITPGPGIGGPLPGTGQQQFPELPIAAPERAPGTFVYAKEGNLWSLVAGQPPRQLTSFPVGNFPAFPAVSPDGKVIAFTYYVQPKDPKDPGGTDLYLINRDGGEPRSLLLHDSPGATFEQPFWSLDGATLWFTTRSQKYDGTKYQGEQVQVERVEVAGRQRAVVVPQASSASRSADGKLLAYVKTDPATYAQDLWVAGADGAGAQRLEAFSALFAPAFSPDGSRLVFGAVGDPTGPGAKGPGVAYLPRMLDGLLDWAPRIAEAHGVPWDLWILNSDGSGLRRLTQIAEDAPFAIWSPDGKQIAFSGERALYVVDPDGRNLMRVADEYGSAGLSWVR